MLTDVGPTRAGPARGRIVGIDLARAVAAFGMVIAHYVWPNQSGDAIDLLARATSGRAMPLFALLGGVGVTILTARSANPDRALLIRAVILFVLGVVLQELTEFIAIILQAYALLFVVAPMLRRLPSWVLAALAVTAVAIGGWAHQDLAPTLDSWNEPIGQLFTEPGTVLWSLLFNRPYPFFPNLAFFVIGMILGRLDLRSSAVARSLFLVGWVIGLGMLAVSAVAGAALGIDTAIFDLPAEQFSAQRLWDTTGHSQMPAWVISAAGTSVGVLGLCLLMAPTPTALTRPLLSLGQLALTFYAFQALLIRFVPVPSTVPLSRSLLTALAIFLGSVVFATVWRMRFRSGPLEALLRIGSSRPTSTTAPGPSG